MNRRGPCPAVWREPARARYLRAKLFVDGADNVGDLDRDAQVEQDLVEVVLQRLLDVHGDGGGAVLELEIAEMIKTVDGVHICFLALLLRRELGPGLGAHLLLDLRRDVVDEQFYEQERLVARVGDGEAAGEPNYTGLLRGSESRA